MFILSMSLISKAFAPDSIFSRDSRGASATFGAQPTPYRGRSRHPRAELDDSNGKRLQEKITAAEFHITSG
jgi:hypothetical protein